jgi:hypothetical protein
MHSGLDLKKLNLKCLHVHELVPTTTLKFRNVLSFYIVKN